MSGDRFDHVVVEPTLCEERMDLSFPLGRLQRFPARELTRDRSPRAVGLALSGKLAECGIDRFARDALAGELANEGAIPLGPEPRALLDPVLREIEIVYVPLRAKPIDRAVDRRLVVAFAVQVAAYLGDAARPGREEPYGLLVGAGVGLCLGPSSPHRSDSRCLD